MFYELLLRAALGHYLKLIKAGAAGGAAPMLTYYVLTKPFIYTNARVALRFGR